MSNAWISVEDRLPEANVDVLVFYEWVDQFNKDKKYTYICRASYIPKHTVLIEDKWNDSQYDWDDYCEWEDKDYVPEGWYEESSGGNGDYMSWHIDATVTHWMPLPDAPNRMS